MEKRRLFCNSVFHPVDKPGPPRNITARNVTDSSCVLRWSPPEHDGGSDIVNYIVEKREGYKRTWQHVGTTASTEISARECQN